MVKEVGKLVLLE